MLCGSIMIRSTSAMFPSLESKDSSPPTPPLQQEQQQQINVEDAAVSDAIDDAESAKNDAEKLPTTPQQITSPSNGNLKALFAQVSDFFFLIQKRRVRPMNKLLDGC